jgi:hypothetical protein
MLSSHAFSPGPGCLLCVIDQSGSRKVQDLPALIFLQFSASLVWKSGAWGWDVAQSQILRLAAQTQGLIPNTKTIPQAKQKQEPFPSLLAAHGLQYHGQKEAGWIWLEGKRRLRPRMTWLMVALGHRLCLWVLSQSLIPKKTFWDLWSNYQWAIRANTNLLHGILSQRKLGQDRFPKHTWGLKSQAALSLSSPLTPLTFHRAGKSWFFGNPTARPAPGQHTRRVGPHWITSLLPGCPFIPPTVP